MSSVAGKRIIYDKKTIVYCNPLSTESTFNPVYFPSFAASARRLHPASPHYSSRRFGANDEAIHLPRHHYHCKSISGPIPHPTLWTHAPLVNPHPQLSSNSTGGSRAGGIATGRYSPRSEKQTRSLAIEKVRCTNRNLRPDRLRRLILCNDEENFIVTLSQLRSQIAAHPVSRLWATAYHDFGLQTESILPWAVSHTFFRLLGQLFLFCGVVFEERIQECTWQICARFPSVFRPSSSFAAPPCSGRPS